eukprot:evm.model.scf_3279.2 EVM.evm.TU.scf_3279.2   scf_3279:6333-14946(+)
MSALVSEDDLASGGSLDSEVGVVVEMLRRVKHDIGRLEGDIDKDEKRRQETKRAELQEGMDKIEEEVAHLKSGVRQAEVELDFIKARLHSYKSSNPRGHTSEKLSNECTTLQQQIMPLRDIPTKLITRISKQTRALIDSNVGMVNLLGQADNLKKQLTAPDVGKQLDSIDYMVSEILAEINELAVQRAQVETFTCPICQEERPIDYVFCISVCNHRLCLECSRHMVQEDLKCGKFPLVCPLCKAEPCSSCPSRKDPSQTFANPNEGYCMLHDCDLDLVLEGEEKMRYNKILMDFVVNTNEHMVRCPNSECGVVWEVARDQDHCICLSCDHEWCAKCHVDWHENLSCEQFRQWRKRHDRSDALFEEMKKRGEVKLCPNCQNYGVKDDPRNCNAMTCEHCRKFFCWLCVQPINLRDKHMHFSQPGPCYAKLFEGCEGH